MNKTHAAFGIAFAVLSAAAFAQPDPAADTARQQRMDEAYQAHHQSSGSHALETTKHDAREVGHAVHEDARSAGHAIHNGVRETGHVIHQGVRATGHAIHEGVRATGHAIHEGVDKVAGR